jgi:hypothetical protein
MAIHHGEVPHHWNYFFCLEEDIANLSRWIEFSEENERVYSIELARLLMTATAECDVVAKALCRALNPESKAASISSYQDQLVTTIPELPDSVVEIPRFGKVLHPWDNWRTQKTPPGWWSANNRIKHHRAENFRDANLKNVLNAVAGLMVLLVLLYSRERDSLYPGPTVFEPRTFAHRDGSGIVFHR